MNFGLFPVDRSRPEQRPIFSHLARMEPGGKNRVFRDVEIVENQIVAALDEDKIVGNLHGVTPRNAGFRA